MNQKIFLGAFVVAVVLAFGAYAQRKSTDGLHLGGGPTNSAVFIDGALTVNSTVTGLTAPNASVAFATIDAGQELIQNTLQLNGNLISNATTQAGVCTLNGASPSVCTATVRAGSRCVASITGTTAAAAAAGTAVSVSSTTLTITSANAGGQVVQYFCF